MLKINCQAGKLAPPRGLSSELQAYLRRESFQSQSWLNDRWWKGRHVVLLFCRQVQDMMVCRGCQTEETNEGDAGDQAQNKHYRDYPGLVSGAPGQHNILVADCLKRLFICRHMSLY